MHRAGYNAGSDGWQVAWLWVKILWLEARKARYVPCKGKSMFGLLAVLKMEAGRRVSNYETGRKLSHSISPLRLPLEGEENLGLESSNTQ